MARVVKHWNVMISTQQTFLNGTGPIRIGKSREDRPVIEHGFLMFVDHKGCHAGINLSEVAAFSIEPEFEE